MKKSILILIALFLVGLAFFAGPWGSRRSSVATGGSTAQAVVYTCPMHPAYRSDHPGTCPICGMALVPVKSGSDTAKGGAAATDRSAPRRSTRTSSS